MTRQVKSKIVGGVEREKQVANSGKRTIGTKDSILFLEWEKENKRKSIVKPGRFLSSWLDWLDSLYFLQSL